MPARQFHKPWISMYFFFSIFVLVSQALAPLHRVETDAASSYYLVVFKEGLSPNLVSHHMRQAEDLFDKPIDAEAHILQSGERHKFVKFERVFNGFAGRMTDEQLDEIRNWETVDFVTNDRKVKLALTQTKPVNWGLDRIDQAKLPLDLTYRTNATGCGINAYVIDTGVDYTNPDFEGRAFPFDDRLGGTGLDCNGHGTHVAGIIASKTYGVAKRANVFSARALDCSGAGWNSDIITALENVMSNGKLPAVVNLSMTSFWDIALNWAVSNAVKAGFVIVVAAGNNAGDACGYSPASEPMAITVGATMDTDSRATWSNFGTCLDLFAPGNKITSWDHKQNPVVKSGTSMASPHVAGIVALMLELNPAASPATIRSIVNTNASPNVVLSPNTGSPNLLARIPFTSNWPAATGACSYTCATACPSNATCYWGECREPASEDLGADPTLWFAQSYSFGPIQLDQSTNRSALTLSGTTYSKGLGLLGNSLIHVALDGQYDRFTAVLGVDDSAGSGNGHVTWRVEVDDVTVVTTGAMKSWDAPVELDVYVDGAAALKIFAEAADEEENNYADIAIPLLHRCVVPTASGDATPHPPA